MPQPRYSESRFCYIHFMSEKKDIRFVLDENQSYKLKSRKIGRLDSLINYICTANATSKITSCKRVLPIFTTYITLRRLV